ncbi:MAG: putative zinc-binding peptidase [Agriterribacter sp.]
MKLFTCSKCSSVVYFENTECLHCGSSLGFDPLSMEMVPLQQIADKVYLDLRHKRRKWRFCSNVVYHSCNWLIPSDSKETFCTACALNDTVPYLGKTENLTAWQEIEAAKHRLVYSLLRLGLPFQADAEETSQGLRFEFLEDSPEEGKVKTGHKNGTITINLNEANEAYRAQLKAEMGESYRTLPGHLRHETGHFYWDLFFADDPVALERFRKMFDDERTDYEAALEAYYKTHGAAGWSDDTITPYATAHPWEDWAESFAHYLHIMDGMETAYYFGIAAHPRVTTRKKWEMDSRVDPYEATDFREIISGWILLKNALNAMNTGMGQEPFYPFVISAAVMDKLTFIHSEISKRTRTASLFSGSGNAFWVAAAVSVGAIAGALLVRDRE